MSRSQNEQVYISGCGQKNQVSPIAWIAIENVMQVIVPCTLLKCHDPDLYEANHLHENIHPPSLCPYCQSSTILHRHGTYRRYVLNRLALAVLITVARFLCAHCYHTISCLPGFAMTYRLLGVDTFQAYLDGLHERADVQSYWELLRAYARRMQAFGDELLRSVGYAFGQAPPPAPCDVQGLWNWIKGKCGSLESATLRLISDFRLTVFGRYQCHQAMAKSTTV